MKTLKVKKLHPDAILPTYATAGSACFDLYSIDAGKVGGSQGRCTLRLRTGLAFEVPPGHVMQVFSRSGHGFKYGIRLANCVGVIDSDYRGEVEVMLVADSPSCTLDVGKGDRIAQAIVVPFERQELAWAEELTETARGAAGFGSTGA